MTSVKAMSGYRRNDGRVGLRDHVVVLATVSLVNRWAVLAAEGMDALVISGEAVRGLRGGDAEALDALMSAIVRHPNSGAVLALCQDPTAAERLRKTLGDLGKPVAVLALLDRSGMEDAVETARRTLRDLREARSCKREPIEISDLAIALECGGSDPTSALASNAAIGRYMDRVIDAGGTALVSETVEFIGAEPAIAARIPDDSVRASIFGYIAARERWHEQDGEDYRGVNPTAENIAGGLTTLVEKSMGAVVKTGTRPFSGSLAFGEAPDGPGLYFMDSPFYTPLSFTGMVQAGCNLALFGIGQFNPSANPLVPTIKICGNASTVARWRDAFDVDASGVLSGQTDLDGVARMIADMVCAVASGSNSASERWGEGQFIMPRNHPPL